MPDWGKCYIDLLEVRIITSTELEVPALGRMFSSPYMLNLSIYGDENIRPKAGTSNSVEVIILTSSKSI